MNVRLVKISSQVDFHRMDRSGRVLPPLPRLTTARGSAGLFAWLFAWLRCASQVFVEQSLER